MGVHPEVLVEKKPLEKNLAHWTCGEITGNEDQQASQILELFDSWDGMAVGMERFILRQLAVELSPVRITAKVEYGLWLMEKWAADEEERDPGRPRHVWKQDPSLAMRTLSDDRMREVKLWTPGKDHKRVAIKHCYTFLQRCQENQRMRAAAWPAIFRANGELLAKAPPTSKRSKY